MASTTRLITLDDAPLLTTLIIANREFLAPWDLVREDSYFTAEGQLAGIQDVLLRYSQGTTVPCVILDQTGRLAGRVMLNGIVRGPLQSCSVGYWVGAAQNGRGLVTRDSTAVSEHCRSLAGPHYVPGDYSGVHN